MKEIDKTVRRETQYVAVWVILLSALMQAVFLIIGHWDVSVLLGNLLTGAISILNFFLLGLTVQRALERAEKDAKSLMRLSQSLRMLMLFAALAVGVALPVFHTWATIIPVFFVRISLLFRPMFPGMDEAVSEGTLADEPMTDGGDGSDDTQ